MAKKRTKIVSIFDSCLTIINYYYSYIYIYSTIVIRTNSYAKIFERYLKEPLNDGVKKREDRHEGNNAGHDCAYRLYHRSCSERYRLY